MIHQILSLVFNTKRQQFIEDSHSLERIQKQKLETIFRALKAVPHYAHLRSCKDILNLPITTYSDYEELIQTQIETGQPILSKKVARYEYTSGSTKNQKKIPYTKSFLNEINEASSVWMSDLYHKYPEIKSGPHYWTLSWSPNQDTDDSELFPFIQRFFLQKVLLLNQKIKSTPTLESSWFATLVNLIACRNLSLISIWSPTLLMRIKRDIQDMAPQIWRTLNEGTWAEYSRELSGLLPVPRFDRRIGLTDLVDFNVKVIWPNLTLISAWDSATSRFYFDELKGQFPDLRFQGKGLWATEGVITIPFDEQKVLAFKSHYYEFKCVQTGKLIPSWELEKDQIVEPVVSSSNGLVRYLIEDRIQVSGFYNSVPCFEFLGRNGTSDFVGEKLTDLDFQNLQKELLKKFPIKTVVFLAVSANIPYYQCVCQMNENNQFNSENIQIFIEKILLNNFNYKVARDLHQLRGIQISFTNDMTKCLDVLAASYAAQGQFKVLSLYRINNEILTLLSDVTSRE